MKVKDCMCTNVYFIKPENTLKDVAKIMSEKHIGCMPVCDDNECIRTIFPPLSLYRHCTIAISNICWRTNTECRQIIFTFLCRSLSRRCHCCIGMYYFLVVCRKPTSCGYGCGGSNTGMELCWRIDL